MFKRFDKAESLGIIDGVPTFTADMYVEDVRRNMIGEMERETILYGKVGVEVLTVHFERRTMRIRFVRIPSPVGRKATWDVPAETYFELFGG
jgi:hypothetical protein